MTESGEYDVQSLIFDEKELEGIPETEEFNLDTHIEGSGENTNVTMEYGDYVISFSPEIIEDEQNMEKATAGNVEVQEGIKTFSSEEEETEEEETEENLFQTEKESEIDIENISEDNEGNHAFEVVEYEYQDITEEETQTEAESEIVEKTSLESETDSEMSDAFKTDSERKGEGQTEDFRKEEMQKSSAQIPDSTIRYRKLENGVKEELVIYGYRGGHRVDYQFRLSGLHPVQEGQKISLKNDYEIEMARISAPYLYDAVGAECLDIQVMIQKTGDGEYELSYIPSDAWLADPSRVYPVVLDPTITTGSSQDVEDNHAGDGSDQNNHYPHDLGYMYAGNKDGINYITYCRPVIPDNVKEIADEIIITDATVSIYVEEKKGNGPYTFHRVGEYWQSNTIQGSNQPKISSTVYLTDSLNEGNHTLDIKPIVSTWFNTLDQKANRGFAIKGNGKKNDYVKMASSDSGDSHMLKFKITYKRIKESANLNPRITAHSSGMNSGTGYVQLKWNKLSNAEAYYVAVFNGKDYEYFFVGNVNSWSTKGLNIWPTQEEIESGRYKLHADGKGAELPCIPAFTYENVKDGKYKDSLLYFFRVVPANEYGQAINPKLFDAVSTVLPDAIAPNQPTSVAVSPSTYSNSKTFSVSWNGVTDFTTASTSLVSNLGNGEIQYSIDGTTNWTNTDKNTASGSYTFDASKLKDGEHTVYIRGRDANGNVGVARGAKFYIDRTGPAGHVVQVQPEDWSKENDVTLSISGMKDMNSIKKIEYRIDEGEWKDTGKTTGSFAGYNIDISNTADGCCSAN